MISRVVQTEKVEAYVKALNLSHPMLLMSSRQLLQNIHRLLRQDCHVPSLERRAFLAAAYRKFFRNILNFSLSEIHRIRHKRDRD